MTDQTKSDFVLVPHEPTQAMLNAALDRKQGPDEQLHVSIYRAMIAAAPTQPAASREDVARIVEPDAWALLDQCGGDLDHPYLDQKIMKKGAIVTSLKRADAILALFPTTQAQPADVEGAELDPRTGRPFGDHGDANDAIEWALDHPLSCNEVTFLHCWRDGNTEDWPEFYAWLKEKGR